MGINNTCVIYIFYQYNDNVRDHILKLYNDTKDKYDFYAVYHIYEDNTNYIEDFRLPEHINIINHKLSDIIKYTPYENIQLELNIPIWNNSSFSKNIGGDNILSVQMFWFYKLHPEYEYYWFIEGDCYFNGKYNWLCNQFENKNDDLLAPHYYRFGDNTQIFYNGYNNWAFYKYNLPDNYIIFYKCWTGFIRISNKLLDKHIELVNKGCYGSDEVLIPTIGVYEGFKVNDFNIYGNFYKLGSQDGAHYIFNSPKNQLSSINVGEYNYTIEDLDKEENKNKILHKFDLFYKRIN